MLIFGYMTIHSTLKLGAFHPVFCEDFQVVEELSSNHLLAAVMDGCSMGKDSHFAATLTGKILKKIVKEIGYQVFAGDLPDLTQMKLEEIGKQILQRFWSDFRQISNQLFLDQLEQLTTIVLAIVELPTNCAHVWIVGDGFIAGNGIVKEIDQGNKPDYFGYHLSRPFEEWYGKLLQQFDYEGLSTLSIATDGVGSFEKLGKQLPDFEGEIVPYLLTDNTYAELPTMLDKKMRLLEENHGWVATDDVSIIRMEW